MSFLVIFLLVTFSDPYPTLSSSVAGKVEESQLAPSSQEKHTVVAVPIVPKVFNDHSNSSSASASQLFYKSYFSRETATMPVNQAYGTALPIMKLTATSNVKGNKAENEETIKSSLYSEETAASPLILKLDRVYTPLEIAEYIFTTGDEKGFAQGVAEMLEDGEIMMSRDDVLLFLETVQRELANLQRQDEQVEKSISGGGSIK